MSVVSKTTVEVSFLVFSFFFLKLRHVGQMGEELSKIRHVRHLLVKQREGKKRQENNQGDIESTTERFFDRAQRSIDRSIER